MRDTPRSVLCKKLLNNTFPIISYYTGAGSFREMAKHEVSESPMLLDVEPLRQHPHVPSAKTQGLRVAIQTS